jgi:hypothetical protein
MSQKPTGHTVRRIMLPSGRAIEVVRFNEPDDPPDALHVCPSCASPLMQALSWSERPSDRWELERECPNCWWTETAVHGREQVEQFEDHLDEGLAAMLVDLQRLAVANMGEEIERFSRALGADLILPEDF